MKQIETTIFHSLFANGLINSGYKGVKITNPDKVGTLDVVFDESECKAFMDSYDKENCINPLLVINFIKSTQEDYYNELKDNCGDADTLIIKSLIKCIEDNGIVSVLKNGFDIQGMSFGKHFEVFAKKPADFSVGVTAKRDYELNDYWCIHEFKYCDSSQEEIDFALFVNGLPLFDFELKTRLASSQYTYQSAIEQYEDRVKKSMNGSEYHKYWSNKTGMIAHFAIDDNNAYVCSDMINGSFRPFNIGVGSGIAKRSGNPTSKSGFSVEYLYQEFVPAETMEKDFIDNILSKDMMANIINNFVYMEKGRLIFPRYHQLNVVTRLEQDIITSIRDGEADGMNFLIQHSAGSGKTKSITWLAYKLQAMQKPDSTYLFGSVIILTDRKVVIGQLGESVWGNDKREDDMVARIENAANKSDALKTALEQEKRIITCTIQSFLSLEEKIDFQSDKKFVVIVDESHSSTDGKDIDAVKKSIEAMGANISLIGFTATPKKATLITFGSRYIVVKDDKGNEYREYLPYDVYSMRQAIEEEYILDVFSAYNTVENHCRLVLITNDKEVEKNYAKSVLQGMKDEKGLTIPNKVEFIIRDFYENFYDAIDGEAKAMVLANSIEEAVFYYKTFKEMLPVCIYPEMQTIDFVIAYSGTDAANNAENDYNQLKAIPSGDCIQEKFDKDSNCKMLLAVDKYQTGYDQPKLCVMYIDKELNSNVQIVQTLSRINRPYIDSNGNMKPISIIDFRNSFSDIKRAFEEFYETTYLRRQKVTVAELKIIFDRMMAAETLTTKMLDDITKGVFSEILIVGQKLENEMKSSDKTVVDRAKKKISDIYNYTRLYRMLMEDDEQRGNIIESEFELAYIALERMKNFTSSLIRMPAGKKKQEIRKDVAQFVVSQTINSHDGDKMLVAHGEIKQGFRESKLRDNDEKEKLSVLIKELNGKDDISEIVDYLSHKPKLRMVAENPANTEKDFASVFRDYFLNVLSDMLDDDKIDFENYTHFYEGWNQVSGFVYQKILNTKK